MFETVFKQFDQVVKEKSHNKRHNQIKAIRGEDEEDIVSKRDQDGNPKLSSRRVNKKKKNEMNKRVELTLAIAIIMANLSSDEEFINTLLGVDTHWKKALKD